MLQQCEKLVNSEDLRKLSGAPSAMVSKVEEFNEQQLESIQPVLEDEYVISP
jgi:hypothetical protein